MRKLVVTAVACGLVLVMAACSSSSKSAGTTSTTSKVDPAVKAKNCALYQPFAAKLVHIGTTPAEFQAAAATFRQIAPQLATTAPPSLSASASSFAADMNKAADKLSSATTHTQAEQAIGTLAFLSAQASRPFVTWWYATCK